MPLLSQTLYYMLLLLLGSLLAIIFFKMVTGRINMSGLFMDKATGERSPGRIQKLFFTIIIAMYYLFLTYKNPTQFPEIPAEMLYVLGGSSSFYLLGKAQSVHQIFTQSKKTP